MKIENFFGKNTESEFFRKQRGSETEGNASLPQGDGRPCIYMIRMKARGVDLS